jgi:hypothetical protein
LLGSTPTRCVAWPAPGQPPTRFPAHFQPMGRMRTQTGESSCPLLPSVLPYRRRRLSGSARVRGARPQRGRSTGQARSPGYFASDWRTTKRAAISRIIRGASPRGTLDYARLRRSVQGHPKPVLHGSWCSPKAGLSLRTVLKITVSAPSRIRNGCSRPGQPALEPGTTTVASVGGPRPVPAFVRVDTSVPERYPRGVGISAL